jgi:hypothetical protein
MIKLNLIQASHRASILVAFCLLPGLVGCATCTNGTTQEIPVSTSPSGASVVVNDIHMGETPCTIRLARKSDHTVVLEAPGHRIETRYITRKPSGAVRGNIWLGGLIGWGVDAATGADNNLVPDSIHIDLQPESPTVRSRGGDVDENAQSLRTNAGYPLGPEAPEKGGISSKALGTSAPPGMLIEPSGEWVAQLVGPAHVILPTYPAIDLGPLKDLTHE